MTRRDAAGGQPLPDAVQHESERELAARGVVVTLGGLVVSVCLRRVGAAAATGARQFATKATLGCLVVWCCAALKGSRATRRGVNELQSVREVTRHVDALDCVRPVDVLG